MAKIDKVYQEALSLAKAFDDNFIDLARLLRTLYEGSGKHYKDFVENSGIDSRKAYYLIALDRTFNPFKIPKKRLTRIGWTKLMVLEPHVNGANVHAMLGAAEVNTVAQLKKIVMGEDAPGRNHTVLMYFRPKDYLRLLEALVAHGAKRSGRGLVNKEEAIMALIQKVRD